MKASQGQEHELALTKILLTSLSAMVAKTTTFPIDLTKTRLQLHGESLSSSTRPTKAFQVASEIVCEQGPLGLYKGLSPAILRHLFYTLIWIIGYEHFRNVVCADAGSLSLSAKALVGGIFGVMAQVVASPTDLVKVRMQADGRMVSQGRQPRYSGPFDALNKIMRTEGFKGLWKEVFPNVQRAFLIAPDNIFAHTLAFIMSGLSATALSCPADVLKTRTMNQVAGKQEKIMYTSSYDCLVKTVRSFGIRSLW
ncbi:hypothetical protein CIPAW_05G131400 [Carya illinoinensis]|uniref:Mitochondrial uncoupling protein 3 n=1 Tax=Carya illinoinensis TaxID=32201 RepID=A0A8T1QJ84_CARIL|nr:hypothetical protein CIPAW_05G131400 [Carya illinoinensis]